MPTYSYARCLKNAYKVNWKIDDLLGDRQFDVSKHWLPGPLTGASYVGCLSQDEKRKLTHVEMASYAHLFGYVEEFVAPKVSELAQDFALDGREAYDALTNFAAEEVKHMTMFRRLRDRVNQTLGIEARLVGDQVETARYVLSKSTGAVLLLTACIEWLSQLHFTAAFAVDTDVDPFTKAVFRAHWQEESQHAQLDHLETVRCFEDLDARERDQAVTDLIELVGAVDGLLQKQSGFDVQNFGAYVGRTLSGAEEQVLYASILRAKRWTFIESGVTHPRFQELFAEVSTPAQRKRVGAALSGLGLLRLDAAAA
jgi:hypothetical protein